MLEIPKLITREEARRVVADAKATGKRVVFANGCFDILHGGHVSYLEAARSAGDLLIVGVNSDASVHELKGEGRPIVPERERAELLAGMEAVDHVVLFDEPTCAPLLEALRPHVHAKGTDYTLDTVPERETSLALGIEILIAGAPKQNATRKLIQQMSEATRG
jgi:rfaE bifunctional protein nucleotidyltransferase chain/domain